MQKVPTAAALGFFDGVHKGHAEVIRKVRGQGLRTAVITFIHNPGKVENGRPVPEITTPVQKKRILESMGVDLVVYLDFERVRDMEPEAFIALLCDRLDVRFISCGFNYRFGRDASAGVRELDAFCAARGVELFPIAPVCAGDLPLSSTRIRACVAAGDVKRAAMMLGRPFSIFGEVVHGRQLGRTLGTPTINQLLPPPRLLPRFGVYASLTHIDGRLLPSVTNVGVKPTISDSEAAGAETYILDFAGDLYGRELSVDLLDFVRPERQFDSLDALRAQLLCDTRTAREMIGRYQNAVLKEQPQ